jgi:integrase
VRLRYIKAVGEWPSGRPRLYYRKDGKYTPLPDLPTHHPEFLAAYAKAATGDAKATKPISGTMDAALVAFMRSDVYLSVSDATRRVWRRGIEDMRQRYGSAAIQVVKPMHVETDLKRFTGNPANQRLKIWRAVGAWWQEQGLTRGNVTEGIKRRRVAKSDGHTPLSEDDVARVRARWPLDTPERLAFELVHWTGARISEAATLTEGMIGKDGWLTYRQGKTRNVVSVPIYAPAPAWAVPDGQLAAALAARKERHMALMVTAYGKPRSVKGASQWFAAILRAAGIEGKSAHGLRKYRAILMAENGATPDQRMAWLGHESITEADNYSRAADRRRLISGNPSDKLPEPTRKPLSGND